MSRNSMASRRTRAALPVAALTGLAFLAAGCAAASSSAAAAGPAASTSGGAAGSAGTSSSASSAPPAASASPGNPGPAAPPVPTSTAATTPVPGAVDCAGWPAGAKKGPVGLFQPVSVLRCVTGITTVPGQGTFLAATLERATSDFGPLLAALRTPRGQAQTGQMCPMIAMLPPQVVLVAKDGSTLSPTIPQTGCGQYQQPVLTALAHMPWTAISVRLYPAGQVPVPTATPALPGVRPSTGGQMNGIPQVNANR